MGHFRPCGHNDVSLGSYFMNLNILTRLAVTARQKTVVVQFSYKLADLIESYSFLYIGVYSGLV